VKQLLQPVAEVEVEHAHDQAHIGVGLLCGQRRVDVADVVLLEHRHGLGVGHVGLVQGLLVAVVAVDDDHAELAHARLQPAVGVLGDDDDVDAQRAELLEHARRQDVRAAQDDVVAHGLLLRHGSEGSFGRQRRKPPLKRAGNLPYCD
jgi:hypothetical protein